MAHYAYPYCRHGAYVGGIAEDYLCGACEMGDPDPTPAELDAVVAAAETNKDDILGGLLDVMVRTDVDFIRHPTFRPFLDALVERLDEGIAVARNAAVEARRWATGDDDDQWTRARHRADAREWADASREEQLGSLPASVLDGRY